LGKVKIKNIIFDLGNTLVYYDHNCFFDGVARFERKFKVNYFQNYIKSKKLDITLATGKINHIEFYSILKKKFNLKISYEDLLSIYNDVFWENTDMKKFLSRISDSKRFKLFMLSNTDSAHIKYINEKFTYIDTIKKRILSYNVKLMKPDKRIYEYVIKKYKLRPEKTLYIDDLKENVLAAKSKGMKSIQYTTHNNFLKKFNKLILN
jgi:putative hydrolase of the HAD superfamily